MFGKVLEEIVKEIFASSKPIKYGSFVWVLMRRMGLCDLRYDFAGKHNTVVEIMTYGHRPKAL